MTQEAHLEKKALDELRCGDLRSAHATLVILSGYRPNDEALRRRIKQVEGLIAQREDAQARIQAEPLRYAHAYIQAGRLAEGLQLLRAALARDPKNQRLRDLALEVARRLRDQVQARTPSESVPAVSISSPTLDGGDAPLGSSDREDALARERAKRAALQEAARQEEARREAERQRVEAERQRAAEEARLRADAEAARAEEKRRADLDRQRLEEEAERLRLEAEARAHYEAGLAAKRAGVVPEADPGSLRQRRIAKLQALLAKLERRPDARTPDPMLPPPP